VRARIVLQLKTLREIYEEASGDEDEDAVADSILSQLEPHPLSLLQIVQKVSKLRPPCPKGVQKASARTL
jgi:hypothetical protein